MITASEFVAKLTEARELRVLAVQQASQKLRAGYIGAVEKALRDALDDVASGKPAPAQLRFVRHIPTEMLNDVPDGITLKVWHSALDHLTNAEWFAILDSVVREACAAGYDAEHFQNGFSIELTTRIK